MRHKFNLILFMSNWIQRKRKCLLKQESFSLMSNYADFYMRENAIYSSEIQLDISKDECHIYLIQFIVSKIDQGIFLTDFTHVKIWIKCLFGIPYF